MIRSVWVFVAVALPRVLLATGLIGTVHYVFATGPPAWVQGLVDVVALVMGIVVLSFPLTRRERETLAQK
jgi:hypothetical protein